MLGVIITSTPVDCKQTWVVPKLPRVPTPPTSGGLHLQDRLELTDNVSLAERGRTCRIKGLNELFKSFDENERRCTADRADNVSYFVLRRVGHPETETGGPPIQPPHPDCE